MYALHAIDGEALPEPVAITERGECLEYEAAKAMWAQLTQDWCQANGVQPPARPNS